MTITSDTPYHQFIAQMALKQARDEDISYEMQQARAVVGEAAQANGMGYMVIETTDVGITLGFVASHLSPDLVDGFFRPW